MEKIDGGDLLNIVAAKSKVEISVVEAEKYALAAKLADAQYRMVVNNIFMKYGLSKGDTIDDKTGEITRSVTEKEINNDDESEGTG